MGHVATSTQDCKLVSSFETVRRTLLQDRFHDRLKKPLAYWALPNDRRLPLAFLNRSIGDLVNTPFEELSATPGIGEKKISSLVKLLMRATSDQPPAVPFGLAELSEEKVANLANGRTESFNAFMVSEVLWSQWTQSVRQHNLGGEKLGRVAYSLRIMPTVIWEKTLDEYVDLSLAEIRQLRTHGEKRVRCILQAFHNVHQTVQRAEKNHDPVVAARLGSPRIQIVSDWVASKLKTGGIPLTEEVRRYFAEPVLQQIEIDCGRTVHRIARQRLGVDGEPLSVRAQAQSMGVTRARVYQLLDDCHKVMEVRWPEGKRMLDQLVAKFGTQLSKCSAGPNLFLATRQLCFPERSSQIEDAAAKRKLESN